jgi:hypothetical protein
VRADSLPSSPIAKPPPELVSFVERYVRKAAPQTHNDRRRGPRRLMVVPVRAQPVDEEFHPIGDSFDVVTRDISPQGIGIVHTHRVHHKRLALQLRIMDKEINFVVEVAWCKAMGPYEYVGGRLVAKLDRFPTGV